MSFNRGKKRTSGDQDEFAGRPDCPGVFLRSSSGNDAFARICQENAMRRMRGLKMTQDVDTGKAGPSFEDFLDEQGTCEETTERAARRVLAMRVGEVM